MLRVDLPASKKTDKLWGAHTLEICYVDCPLDHGDDPADVRASHASQLHPAPPRRAAKQMQSDAIVMVGHEGLLFVLIADPREAVVDMPAAFRRGHKYTVPFKAISDIRVLKTEDDATTKVKPLSARAAPSSAKPRSVVVHIKGNQAVCRVDTVGTTHLAKQMQAAWSAYLVMQTARIGKVQCRHCFGQHAHAISSAFLVCVPFYMPIRYGRTPKCVWPRSTSSRRSRT